MRKKNTCCLKKCIRFGIKLKSTEHIRAKDFKDVNLQPTK